MYSITKKAFGNLTAYVLGDDRQELVVVPKFGGMVNQWTINWRGEQLNLLDGYESGEELSKDWNLAYKGFRLIPYPNRIRKGNYRFQGQDYSFPLNFIYDANSIHGFISELQMELEGTEEYQDYAVLRLKYAYSGDRESYPFPVDFHIAYTLSKDFGLAIQTSAVNTGKADLPFGDGWHPYFTTGTPLSEMQLELHAESVLNLNEEKVPDGTYSSYNEFEELKAIGAAHFDNCFVLKNPDFKLVDPVKQLAINFQQDLGPGKYNYVQFFTPDHRKSIAVEPMSCEPNAFNTGKGLIVLAPGERVDLKHSVRVTEHKK